MDAHGESDSPRTPRYQPLVIIAVAAMAGIVLSRYGPSDWFADDDRFLLPGRWFAAWWLLAVLSLSVWWLLWHRQRHLVAVLPLLLATAWCAAAWHDLRWAQFDDVDIGRFAAYDVQPTCVEAIAHETPDQLAAPQFDPLRAIPGEERSRLLIDVTAIRDGTEWRPAAGNCQLTVNGHLLDVHAGDRLWIVGQIARPAPPLNPGEFDFAAHARADRQLARLVSSAPECVRVRERGSVWSLARLLDSARNRCKAQIRKFVGPNRADLAAAILLGAREGLQSEETEPYLVTGTIHVLVVSGMNVAILAAGLLGMMRVGWLARRAALAIIVALVIGYALLTEMQPPVVRAAVFGILLCVAAWTGRRGAAFNSFAAAALIVLAINPADLFRPGPQLSFLAVAALIWIGQLLQARRRQTSDRLSELLNTQRPWYWQMSASLVRATTFLLITSLAVWLITLPLVLMSFHVGSTISVVISPAVWIFVCAAMWCGFIMLAAGWLIPIVGAWCGAICNESLGGLESVVAWAHAVPGGHFWAPGPAWWWVLGFYVGLFAVLLWGRALVSPRWQLASLGAWILIGLVPPLVRDVSRDGLACTFVAVGHGTCVLLEAPTGETLLYDAGALGSPQFATQSIASYLWHRGIMRIDGLVVSHADVDHYNAVPGLLERFRVGTVYISPVMFNRFDDAEERGAPQAFAQAVRAAQVPIRKIWGGDRLRIGPELTVDVLHPPQIGVIGNDNANSLTLAVEYRGRRILLPGDLESPGLDDLLAELPYDCDVLLAPHHGSRQSDPPGFAAWSTPEWVVVSGSATDVLEPVAATYRLRGAEVLHTHERGAVRFLLEPKMTQVSTCLGPG